MKRLLRFFGYAGTLTLVLAGVPGAYLYAQKQPAPTSPPSVAWKAPLRAKPSEYVGSMECAGCHRAEAQAFFKTPHAHLAQEVPVEPATPAKPESPSVAAGRKIYNNMMCAGCHQIGGKGGTAAPALDDVGARWTRAQVMQRMLERRAGTVMPPLPSNMPTSQIDDLVDYLMTLKGKPSAEEAPSTALTAKTVAGCEMCHGPGRAHAEAEQAAGGNVAKQLAAEKLIFSFNGTPQQDAARCLSCHISSAHQQFFDESVHAMRGVSCNSCHAIHLVAAVTRPKDVGLSFTQAEYYSVPQLPVENQWLHDGLLKEPQPKLCFQCHTNVEAQFAMPFHHRVPEGLMKCTSCHTPHGTLTAFHQLNQPDFQACVKCHTEVGGPFIYEHAAVKIVGCVGCHNPHGGPNHFMLVRRETRFICLQCHTGFHTQAVVPHGPSTSFENMGDCTRCHIAIHGSNFDPDFVH